MEVMNYIKLAQSGDKEALEYLVKQNVGLIWSIVKRYTNRGYDNEELYQIGSVGLLKAIYNFNLEYDVKFSTYAVPMIQGEIRRFLRDDGLVRVSRAAKENCIRIKRAKEELEKENNKEPTIEELSERTGISVGDIITALECDVQYESIERKIYENEGRDVTLEESISSGRDDVGELIDNIFLKQMLDTLEEKDRKLINMRYFEGMNQTQIAKVLGISQVQVSRLEKKILLNMRKNI